MLEPVYCPRCGTRTERRLLDGRERDVCPACGFVLYRNPIPAVGVVVALEDERLVLVRRRYEPRADCWALPAGYMELGESAEEAAARECHEETGLLVRIDHLLGVYSFGEGEVSGLVIIYAASAIGGEMRASDDATEVGAFPPEQLPEPFAFRTHLQAIERWRKILRAPQMALPQTPPAVRRARAADLAAVFELLRFLPNAPDDQAGFLVADALLHDRLHDPDHLVLVAEHAGIVKGFATLTLRQTLVGWRAVIDELVVAPDAQDSGLQESLLEAAGEIARRRGAAALEFTAPSDG